MLNCMYRRFDVLQDILSVVAASVMIDIPYNNITINVFYVEPNYPKAHKLMAGRYC